MPLDVIYRTDALTTQDRQATGIKPSQATTITILSKTDVLTPLDRQATHTALLQLIIIIITSETDASVPQGRQPTLSKDDIPAWPGKQVAGVNIKMATQNT